MPKVRMLAKIPINDSEKLTNRVFSNTFIHDEEKEFCYANCPHADVPCKGDCAEFKAWRKTHRRKYTKK